jgi:hypothetical protein
MRRRISFSLTAAALLLIAGLATNCGSGGVGDPCIPEDEYHPNFSGYGASEVYVESRSFQCATRVCLVNHFQGRVSCPYGQTEADLALAGDDPRRCRIPGTDGLQEDEPVALPVDPWLVERSAEQAVYCSCRCDGPEPNLDYCECPSGYACTELVPELGLDEGNLAGSYCVKSGPKYSAQASADCRANPQHPACPKPSLENP